MKSNIEWLDRTGRATAGGIVAASGVAALLGALSLGPAFGFHALVTGTVLAGTGLTEKEPLLQIRGLETAGC